jgi:hypothetical protein
MRKVYAHQPPVSETPHTIMRVLEKARKGELFNDDGRFGYVRPSDFRVLKQLDTIMTDLGRKIETVYYPGSSADVGPLFALEHANHFTYQESDNIIKNIPSALAHLSPQYVTTPIKVYHNNGSRVAQIPLKINRSPFLGRAEPNFQDVRLVLLENSDVTEESASSIHDADLIFGNNTLISENLIADAKSGAMLFDHNGIGLDHFAIKDNPRLIEEYGLSERVITHPEDRFAKIYIKK